MAHIETIGRQNEFYIAHKREILSSGYRFAVINGSTRPNVAYFNSRTSLYKAFPCLNPSSRVSYETLPLLVDIGRKTKSVEYRRERLVQQQAKFEKNLLALLERGERLVAEQKMLQGTGTG